MDGKYYKQTASFFSYIYLNTRTYSFYFYDSWYFAGRSIYLYIYNKFLSDRQLMIQALCLHKSIPIYFQLNIFYCTEQLNAFRQIVYYNFYCCITFHIKLFTIEWMKSTFNFRRSYWTQLPTYYMKCKT